MGIVRKTKKLTEDSTIVSLLTNHKTKNENELKDDISLGKT